jgi:hypothetical protein
MSDTSNNDDGAIECLSIRGVLVDLRSVSHALRQKYHAVSRAVGRGDKAREQLQAVCEAILNEQAPALATKAFIDAHKRSGHSAIDRLMKAGLSK